MVSAVSRRDGIAWPPARRSVAGPGRCPSGERDDGAAAGMHVAELLVFQGELVDGADQGGGVGAELGEFLRSVWRWVSALRGTPASMASATTVSAPLDRSGADVNALAL
jgi:hypothetical protein